MYELVIYMYQLVHVNIRETKQPSGGRYLDAPHFADDEDIRSCANQPERRDVGQRALEASRRTEHEAAGLECGVPVQPVVFPVDGRLAFEPELLIAPQVPGGA